ncbi:rhomboid family intramembrane serine protease [Luteococcus sp. Sow4_B9]|uniref:rhomboid family intramembrane serine protease n=1 Tax=Luteococcus sp. Sow4_B9 TaxID=3438792 RepID=UPI003F97BC9D
MTVQWPSASPQQQRPRRPQLAVVTYTIIALCAAVWLAELTLPGFYEQVALSAHLGQTQPWRLITSAFAHALTPMHILFNMFALWSVGRWMELALGRPRFAALYLLSALGGSVGYILLAMPPTVANPVGINWYKGVVGASGAVFGLFGALLPMYRHVGASSRSMWGVLLINAVISFTLPGIAWQAHLGGFLTGLVTAQLMMRAVRQTRRGLPNRTWPWIGVVAAVLVLALVAKYALV